MSFNYTADSRRFRSGPTTRILGSIVGWFLFALNFTLLYYSVVGVMSIGGSCASGGPYTISVECPPQVDVFLPWCIFGGLAAVGIAAFFAPGFGVPVTVWSWPILFGSLGALFLAAFFGTGDPTGLILGVIFEVMALTPLVIEVRASWQRILLGTVNLGGERFIEGSRARRSLMSPGLPNPEDAVAPTTRDWLLSIGLLVVSAPAGVWVAQSWFFAVGAAAIGSAN